MLFRGALFSLMRIWKAQSSWSALRAKLGDTGKAKP
jgi:hypothetical protein